MYFSPAPKAIKLLVPRAGHLVALIRQSFRRSTNGIVPLTIILDTNRFGTDIVPLTEADFSDVFKSVCVYMNIPVAAPVLEVATFLTSLQTTEIDFRLVSSDPDHKPAAQALAASLRYHLNFESVIFDDSVASFVFDSLRHNDVLHSLTAYHLWPSSLLDLSASLCDNVSNSIQVTLHSRLNYHKRFLTFRIGDPFGKLPIF